MVKKDRFGRYLPPMTVPGAILSTPATSHPPSQTEIVDSETAAKLKPDQEAAAKLLQPVQKLFA